MRARRYTVALLFAAIVTAAVITPIAFAASTSEPCHTCRITDPLDVCTIECSP